ncbi:UDP-N-acetylmuramoylalanyl-D-glutamate--2,6-diaminopimelate ligase [Klenkia marina]|uniref:UDP-N-acetylmuramoylalanyl-D-glutamate--2,6-diaminopimelate ligase n=1 Tax=Klenkia marina TaxID=1960309 RepID=A0A1G4YX01_9ACTN|nr:UDP-N-acetylmuramoylalanyl-D-glutamate--2,6-diaminopimelate ligase [Klenkia marina]
MLADPPSRWTPLAAVAARAGAALPPAGPVVDALVMDSRRVAPGDLFACVRGARSDGHEHAAAAVAAGAVAVLADRPDRLPHDLGVPVLVVPAVRAVLGPVGALLAGDPADRLRVVAVTGSNGKTTTSTLLAGALGGRCGLLTTVGATVGRHTRSTALTTPEAPDLHRLLRWMVQRGATTAVVEASSIAVDVGRVDGLCAEVAVFTGFEPDHLDHHGTLEQYWASKARLFTPDRARAAVVVTDDPWGRRLADQAVVPVTRVGHDADCDVRVLRGTSGAAGTEVLLEHDGGRHLVRSPVVGRVHVTNLAAAWAAAVAMGVAPATAARRLASVAPPDGRNTLLTAPGSPLVVVDYAHTPGALADAVATASELRPYGEVHLVLGARGARDRWKRQGLGTAARAADHVWLTNEGSHGEDPAAIVAELAVGLLGSNARVRTVLDRRAAITAAVDAAGPEDVVLVVGRGHETLLQDAPGALDPATAQRFADADVARAALGEGRRRLAG